MFAHFARHRFGDLSCHDLACVTCARILLCHPSNDLRVNFRGARACMRVSCNTCMYIFQFPWGIRALSTASNCHAGTIELLRLITPTGRVRLGSGRKWNVVVLIIMPRTISFFVFLFYFFILRFRSCQFNSRTLLRARILFPLFFIESLKFRLIDLCQFRRSFPWRTREKNICFGLSVPT